MIVLFKSLVFAFMASYNPKLPLNSSALGVSVVAAQELCYNTTPLPLGQKRANMPEKSRNTVQDHSSSTGPRPFMQRNSIKVIYQLLLPLSISFHFLSRKPTKYAATTSRENVWQGLAVTVFILCLAIHRPKIPHFYRRRHHILHFPK